MNDVLRVDGESWRHARLTCRARCHLVAGALQAWARRPEDDATHAPAGNQAFISRVNDSANAERESDEVADEDFRLH
jgi:hypothetical protein